MTKENILKMVKRIEGAKTDMPFEEDFYTTVLRRGDNGKWFGLIMQVSEHSLFHNGGSKIFEILNVKTPPELSSLLRETHSWIIPAYHMSKVHWNTILLSGDASEEETEQLLRLSYDIVGGKKKTKQKQGKGCRGNE